MSGEADPFIGMRLADRYELEERIGEGRLGAVYRARDHVLERAIAVKLLSPPQGSGPAWLARLGEEAQALARLVHPSTARLYDFGTFHFGDLLPHPTFRIRESLR